MGVLYLAAVLRRAGHEVALALAGRKDFWTRARDFSPDVLAYSVTTGHHKFYLDLNRRLKAALAGRPLAVFGGPHATFFPEIIEEEGVDAVCRGEGEEAFAEFVTALGRGEDYARVANFWVKRDGEVFKNDLRPLVEDLDTLPFPARDLLYDYDRYMREVPLKHFFPLRGCPYLCTYCFNHKFNTLYRGKGEIIRKRSPENVIAEIKEVRARYPLKFVRFLSDNFTIDREWLRAFADLYSREVALPFNCHVRANLINARVAADLARAGCVSVLLGVEAGDDHLRNAVLKRNMSRETIIAACRYLREAGVNVYTQNILALPGETFDQALQTLALNQQCRPAFAWASLFMPYPRTELAEYAVAHGYFHGDYDRVLHTFHRDSVLNFPSERDRRRFTNLHKLFGVMVEWPGLARWAGRLCDVPPNFFYNFIFKLWYGYTNRRRIFPYPLTVAGFLGGLRRFWRKDEA